ncbi:MAG: RNA methyltransferase [Candidatus Bathyarchaeota archaeon]|nr:RNA methyltransferase [Candidatus Bathyarchaeota archaeon]
MAKKHVIVAFPASVISDTPHLREKTAKIGYIGRAAAIFKVSELIVYADNPKVNQRKDIELIVTWLNYMDTPQYLRKRLFELKPELQFAGVLPPLRTPHHPLRCSLRDLKVGDYREGVVISKNKEGALVDVGIERPVLLHNSQFEVNKRLTLKVVKIGETVEVQNVDRAEVPHYWGFTVGVENRSFRALLENPRFDLVVGTSKFAVSFQETVQPLHERWVKAKTVLLLFGSPTQGLFEIAKAEHLNIHDYVDFMVNTLPDQGTETVRTEEAVIATLAIFNMYFGF